MQSRQQPQSGCAGYADLDTLTVREFNNATPMGRLLYRLYRHPVVLFGIGPANLSCCVTVCRSALMDKGSSVYWVSAMATNIGHRRHPRRPDLTPSALA